MEALIVALLALIACFALEVIYCAAVVLLRWTPALSAGAAIEWVAERCDFEPLKTLGLAIVVCVLVRHALPAVRGIARRNSPST